MLDHLAQCERHFEPHFRRRQMQLPPLRGGLRDALCDQMIERRHHEERVPAGVLANELRQAVLASVLRLAFEVLGDGAFGQRLEHDVVAKLLQTEVVVQAAQWMLSELRILRAIADHDHQARMGAMTGEGRKHVDRRIIRPMKVLEDEGERRLRRESGEEFADLAQHTATDRADQLPL